MINLLKNNQSPFGRFIFLIIVAVFALAPFIYMISVSFMSLGEAINTQILIPSELRFQNYGIAWDQAKFSNYFFNSVVITICTVLGQLIICSMAGYAFAVINISGRQLLFILVLVTLMVPEAVLISPLYQIILGRIIPIGLMNFVTLSLIALILLIWIYMICIYINTWLKHEIYPARFTFYSMILIILAMFALIFFSDTFKQIIFKEFAGNNWLNTYVVMIIPFLGNAYSIFLFRQFFKQMPDELWQAAKLDGATHFQYFTQVAVPLNIPAFSIIGMLSFIWSWNSFMWPRLTQLDERGHFTLPVGLDSFNRDQGVELQLLMAGAMITVLPVLIIYIFGSRLFINSASRVGIK